MTDEHDPPTGSDADDIISRRIGEWQERLLQLDRRNNLLYFKSGRSTVGITGIEPDDLDRRLAGTRRGLSFPYVPPGRRRRRGFEPSDDAEPDEPVVTPGDLQTDVEPADLQRRLGNLRRKEREWEEEQGLNVLFLATGFLNWVDADGEDARSPLVLIPCDLVRSSPRDPYRLRREDDDPVANPTLRHQLRQSGIELPEFSGESVQAYISDIAERVGGREGWAVDSAIALGTFSYSKLAMYEDMTRMRLEGVRNALTRQLASDAADDGTAAGTPSASPRPDDLVGGRLDDLLDLRDQHAILPADFSQLHAINDARKEANLVIHGPPGTGKSQTIANLIATLLADGKRVLFVSEKTAALDVVKSRLEDCHLGVFCLDLHSDRAQKSAVYEQLRDAMQDEQDAIAPFVEADELIEQRDRLNRLVRVLHKRREPLGLSVYDVQGQFAQLRELPRCDAFSPPRAADLTPRWVANVDRAAAAIARRPDEYREHESSRWLPLRTPQRSLQLTDRICQDMGAVRSVVSEFREAAASHADRLGRPAIRSADDARHMVRLYELLARAPGVPAGWLERDAAVRLRAITREQSAQQQRRERLWERLSGWFGGALPTLDYRAIAHTIERQPWDRQAMGAAIGAGWRQAAGHDPAALSASAHELATALGAVADRAEELSVPLGGIAHATLGQIDAAASLAGRILDLDPVPEGWLTAPTIDDAERKSKAAHALLEDLLEQEGRLHERYSDALVDLVDQDMLVRYRTDHQSFWKRLVGGAYRSDQRVLRGQMKTPGKLSLEEALAAVELALRVRQLRERWDGDALALKDALGARFSGRDTDWERLSTDIGEARGILEDWHQDVGSLRALLADDEDEAPRRALESTHRALGDAVARYREAAAAFDHEPLIAPELDVAEAGDATRRVLGPLRSLSEGTASLYRHLAKAPTDLRELTALVGSGVEWTDIVEEDEGLAPALAEDFGRFFEREKTDWNAVEEALGWTREYLGAAPRMSDRLRHHATDPQPSEEYEAGGARLSAAIDEFSEALRVLDERFDVGGSQWSSWDAADLDVLESWADDLDQHVGGAPGWVEYRDAVHRLDQMLGMGSTAAIRALTKRAEDVPGIVSRSIYEAWLEDVYEAEPDLRAFNRVDHEAVRAKFRELDELFPIAARQRVRERLFGKYPLDSLSPLRSGQLATLNGELSKRRRQMPVRRLIQSIPRLLQTLKPCFLMSPLAVSQYLPDGPLASDRMEFDAVIFDEASQVWPWDAVPAIERANQVIVAGDRHQLPPTNFFRAVGDDDDDTDTDDDAADGDGILGRESILDVMVGQVGRSVSERYLSVHYRSRCESLIRFSNHAFYDNRLITFPGPNAEEMCVRDEYLPDATYEAGGSRTNRGEADRVIQIVFELMDSTPRGDSIGVVALSRAQADLIERLMEERRVLDRRHEDRFSDEREERFFVKNLENVQGDERDHMILSIGYGPTPAGAVPNRFGPINREGGERRLNVAVTRARQSMTVIHSLRAEDITSQAPGARQLRRYLEYVRNPAQALDAAVTGTGEPESPFEDAVLAALRQRGHQVDAQVGVSGYRIDLAIRSEDGGRFDLGIECDGATYHHSPAARDRDWLRQQVLEGLGWRIHRVWSTAWIRNPSAELAAIERALEEARAGQWETQPPAEASPVAAPEEPVRDSGTGLTKPTNAARWDGWYRSIDDVPDAVLDEALLLAARSAFGASQEDLRREAARHFGWQRVGANIRAQMDVRIAELLRDGLLAQHGDMIEASAEA